MSYEFKRLSEVEALNEVPENATVLAEVDGSIKRIPSNGLGGSGGIKTAVIMSSDYYDALAGVSAAVGVPTVEYNCTNMTFEEAYQTMAAGEPLAVFSMISCNDMPINAYCMPAFGGTAMTGEPAIMIGFAAPGVDPLTWTWTSSGLALQ